MEAHNAYQLEKSQGYALSPVLLKIKQD